MEEGISVSSFRVVRVALVSLVGAPPADVIRDSLSRDAIDVRLLSAAEMEREMGVSLALLWCPPIVSDDVLAAAVGWRDAAGVGAMLLGCAPEGSRELAERALAAGFDDFVAGHASPRELAARLRALTRRSSAVLARGGDELRFGRVLVDMARRELVLRDRRVPLTNMELTVLAALVAARGRTLTREQLLDRVWGKDDLEVSPRAVDNLVLRLRRKLGDFDAIVTVRGVGFRLSGD